MTHQKILEKAIRNAIGNGWTMDDLPMIITDRPKDTSLALSSIIIFNHDFAKSLWGEKESVFGNGIDWRYHLQQMVIADDPIEYLGEHI